MIKQQYRKPMKNGGRIKYQAGAKYPNGFPLIEAIHPGGIGADYNGDYFFDDGNPTANLSVNTRGGISSPAVKSFQENAAGYYGSLNPKRALQYGSDSKFGKHTAKAAQEDSKAIMDWMYANGKMSDVQKGMYMNMYPIKPDTTDFSNFTLEPETTDTFDPLNGTGLTTQPTGTYYDPTDPANPANANWATNNTNVNPANVVVDPNANVNTNVGTNGNPGTSLRNNDYALGVTNGKWVSNYNPDVSFQYKTSNASGNYNNGQGLGNMDMMTHFAPKNGQPAQHYNAPNGRQSRIPNGNFKRGLQNVGNTIKGLFNPRVTDDAIQRRIDSQKGLREDIANSKQETRDANYDKRTYRQSNHLDTRANNLRNNALEQQLRANAVEHNQQMLAANKQSMNDASSNRTKSNILARDTRNQSRNEFDKQGDDLQNKMLEARNIEQDSNRNNQSANADKRRLLNRANRYGFQEGGSLNREQYQLGNTYTGSQYQNTTPSFDKPFTMGYQTPSYQYKSNTDDMAKRMLRNNQYNMGRVNAGSQLTPGFNKTLANSLNGNPLAGYAGGAAPVSGMTRDTSDLYPNTNTTTTTNKNNGNGGEDNLTNGERLQLFGEFLPAIHNLAYSMTPPYQAKPAYNKYRYQVYNNMARQQAPTDNSDIYAMQNKGMRDIRSSSPNEQVERANRLALYSGTMDNLNKQKLSNYQINQQFADRATEQLGNIGEQERQANEAARIENIGHEEARDAIRMEGVGQFGTGLVDYGKFKTSAEENEMRMALMGEIYNNYDTKSYGELINSLNNGTIDTEDLVVFKQTGSIQAAQAAKAKRLAQQQAGTNGTTTNTGGGTSGIPKTSTQNIGVSNTSATSGLNGNIQTTYTDPNK